MSNPLLPDSFSGAGLRNDCRPGHCQNRRGFRCFFSPFACGLALIFGSCALLLMLSVQLLSDQHSRRQSFFLTATLPSQEITADLMNSIQNLSGCAAVWPVVSADVSVAIDGWQTAAVIRGVDLDAFPLTVTVSAGEQTQSSSLFLLAGETFFSSFSDENGSAITERQARVLAAQLDGLTAQVTLTAASGDAAVSSAYAVREACFPGLTEEAGLYMDIESLRAWLSSCAVPTSVRTVCLSVTGKTNAENAREILTDAGFQAELQKP